MTNTSFEAASADLAKLAEADVPAKEVERLSGRIGLERCAERDEAVAAYGALPLARRKEASAGVTAPEVAVVSTDGGRIQILDRRATAAARRAAAVAAGTDAPASAGNPADAGLPATPAPTQRPPAGAAAPPVAVVAGTDAPASAGNPARGGRHWREDKVGLLMAMTSKVSAADPCPDIPDSFLDPTRMGKLARQLRKGVPLTEEPAADGDDPEADREAVHGGAAVWEPPEVAHKRLVASRQDWDAFGPMVAAAAWAMGLYGATRRAFLGDGAENNWTLWRNHFGSFVAVLDFIHALSYVYAAAHAGRGRSEGWCCYARWIRWVWGGQVAEVLRELEARQKELGGPAEQDKETSAPAVVDKALTYLRNNAGRMKYDEYRRQGLPITSSYVESAVKQFNQRVKGTEKFWSEDGGEAVLQLRADYLSDGQPLEAFWQRRQEAATGQRSYRRVG